MSLASGFSEPASGLNKGIVNLKIPLIAAAMLLSVGSCGIARTDNHPIPPGLFYSEHGVEQIAVGAKAIYFMIKPSTYWEKNELPGQVSQYIAFYPSMFLDRARGYTVEESGEIDLHLHISTDPFLNFEFIWHEDSRKIAKIDRRTEETVWFSRAE